MSLECQITSLKMYDHCDISDVQLFHYEKVECTNNLLFSIISQYT